MICTSLTSTLISLLFHKHIQGTKSDYLFNSKEQWLRLVYNLPREMACDLIDWSWTAQTSTSGPFKLFSAINISILMNGSDENEQNVNPPNEYTSKMYALRDIKKGEELLVIQVCIDYHVLLQTHIDTNKVTIPSLSYS